MQRFVDDGTQPATEAVGAGFWETGAMSTATSSAESQCSPTDVAIRGHHHAWSLHKRCGSQDSFASCGSESSGH